MRYVILQLPPSHNAKYMHYDYVKKNGYVPNREDYVLVYVGQMWGESRDVESELEHIFCRLNADDRTYDYRVWSPSVSDVIGLETANDQWEFYYIDMIGFKKIWEENL